MTTTRVSMLRWASWASISLPVIAYLFCSEFSTGHLLAYQPSHGVNVVALRHYAFLASGILGAIILGADLVLRHPRLLLLPVASLLLTCWLYSKASSFTRFLEGAEPSAGPNAGITLCWRAQRPSPGVGQPGR